jgi:hypothetical protein
MMVISFAAAAVTLIRVMHCHTPTTSNINRRSYKELVEREISQSTFFPAFKPRKISEKYKATC